MAFPHFADPALAGIYRYWLSRRRDGKPPRRADIRPADLGTAIRNINLIEVLPGKPPAFRHRLVGTAHIEWLGRDATGRMLDEELYGAAAAEIVASLTRIVETGLPYRRQTRLDWNHQDFVIMDAVELPLADEKGDIVMILRGAAFRHSTVKDGGAILFEPLPLA